MLHCITEFTPCAIPLWSATHTGQIAIWITQSSNPYLSKLSTGVTFISVDRTICIPNPSEGTTCSSQSNNVGIFCGTDTGVPVLLKCWRALWHAFDLWQPKSSQTIPGHRLALRTCQELCKAGCLSAVTLFGRVVHFLITDMEYTMHAGFSLKEFTQAYLIYLYRFSLIKFQNVSKVLMFLCWIPGTELIYSCWSQ